MSAKLFNKIQIKRVEQKPISALFSCIGAKLFFLYNEEITMRRKIFTYIFRIFKLFRTINNLINVSKNKKTNKHNRKEEQNEN